MKQTIIKSVFMRTVAALMFSLVTVSASAQYYMNIVKKDGKIEQFLVPEIDNIFFSGQEDPKLKYEFIDLGLSVNWATFNIGATKPEEYGEYYAWGETETKENYCLDTYKFFNGHTLTKYTDIDNKTTLEPEDDVAHVKWGGSWRMPTKVEQNELLNNCTWSLFNSGNSEFNGVAGYKVTSNIEGYTDRFIFLPLAGYFDGDDYDSYIGFYMSSSLADDNPAGAFNILCNSGSAYSYTRQRAFGLSVRPVCPSEEWSSSVSVSMITENKTLVVGGNAILNVVAKKNGRVHNNAPIIWCSDAPLIVGVNKDGVLSALSEGTAHITASIGTVSAQCTVTVIEEPNINKEYVDLGLGVKWATFNVGAISPEDFGFYYAWGETETKKDDYRATYKYYDSYYATYTKYVTASNFGVVDNKTVLEPEDDVAHVKWGGSWRMPTRSEMDDLSNISNCTWIWTTQNGVNGYLVTSKKPGFEGASIFLPAAGYCLGTSFQKVGSSGNYWSSSLYTDNPYGAWYLSFSSGAHSTYFNVRDYGLSVRPVCP